LGRIARLIFVWAHFLFFGLFWQIRVSLYILVYFIVFIVFENGLWFIFNTILLNVFMVAWFYWDVKLFLWVNLVTFLALLSLVNLTLL